MSNLRQLQWPKQKMKAHSCLSVLIFVVLAELSQPSAAQSCADRFKFSFADGTQGCLNEEPFASEPLASRWGTVQQLVPPTGLYSIAASPRIEHCPAVVAMALSRFGPSAADTSKSALVSARSQTALSDCQKGIDSAKPSTATCTCVVVVKDGASPMSRPEFDAFFAKPSKAPK